ncbi:MAG: hypothetical protein ACK4V1_10185, partial [Burkholderiaceae bacterium]
MAIDSYLIRFAATKDGRHCDRCGALPLHCRLPLLHRLPSMSHPRTGARILVDQLLIQGVDHAFCVPGESYLAV